MMSVGLFNDYYRGKRVLVTGHTGFKGSWLTLWLLQIGAEVAGYSAYFPSEPCNFQVLGLSRYVEHYCGDIRNLEQLQETFNRFKPDIVFHLAAQPLVRRSYDEPKLTFDTNIGGTVNVLECIRQSHSVQAAVIITSDKCYKNVEWLWGYRENDVMGGDDPYSASKGCAELVINSYCQSFFAVKGLPVASARAGNVIGGGDWAKDRLVPDCVRAWSTDQEVIIRNPLSTRPWQYVLEPLSGYLWMGALLGAGEIKLGESYNFGPKAEVIQPVSTLINAFQKCWDQGRYVIHVDGESKKESRLLLLCSDKALSHLQWEAVLSFVESIELTALWYKQYYENSNEILDYSKQQIARYALLARERGMKWAMRS